MMSAVKQIDLVYRTAFAELAERAFDAPCQPWVARLRKTYGSWIF
jgi:hypothetical protein